jgi:hypothetical protein
MKVVFSDSCASYFDDFNDYRSRVRTNTWGCDSIACAYILLDDDNQERGDVPGVRTSENTLDFQTTRAKLEMAVNTSGKAGA